MSYQMHVSFDVRGEAAHLLALRRALADPKGATWGRHLIVSALETLLRWSTDAGFWRFELGQATVGKVEKTPAETGTSLLIRDKGAENGR